MSLNNTPLIITVRDLTTGYVDNAQLGVLGYGGKLNIRTAYQREFVYKDKQRDAVIDTITKGYPLGVMYWADLGNNNFEIIDGQQRTISICQFVDGAYSIDDKYFHNLSQEEQDEILNYELRVYPFAGTSVEKLAWFKVINIAGEQLTDQELRNAAYCGPWLTKAKQYFSKTVVVCPAFKLSEKYVKVEVNRQELLEKALTWISQGKIETYMSKHQHDVDAKELWTYFQAVIAWVSKTFPEYRREMIKVDWGTLYNTYKDKYITLSEKELEVEIAKLETEVTKLMADEEVTNKKGIYTYVLTRVEKHLSIRSFDDKQKREAFTKQSGLCPACSKTFKIEEMEADHIIPWSKGGKTISANLKMLCKKCNTDKSSSSPVMVVQAV